METRKVEKLKLAPNIRTERTEQSIMEMMHSMVTLREIHAKSSKKIHSTEEYGLINPLNVYAEGNQEYVAMGATRFIAYNRLRAMSDEDFKKQYGFTRPKDWSWDEIPVNIIAKPKGDLERQVLQSVENKMRSPMNPIDEATLVRAVKHKVGTWAAVAKVLGYLDGEGKPQEAAVKMTSYVLDCPPSAQEAMKAGTLSKGDGLMLKGLPDDTARQLIAELPNLTSAAFREKCAEAKKAGRVAKPDGDAAPDGDGGKPDGDGGKPGEQGAGSGGARQPTALTKDQELLRLLLEHELLNCPVKGKADKSGALTLTLTLDNEAAVAKLTKYLVEEYGADTEAVQDKMAAGGAIAE